MSATTAPNETIPPLHAASDDVIDRVIESADPMVLRGLLYQLTGDSSIREIVSALPTTGFGRLPEITSPGDIAFLRERGAELLKSVRATAETPPFGPTERVPDSLRLAIGRDIPDDEMGPWLEELALDPWARSLEWDRTPAAEQLTKISVLVVGAGMGGLNLAIQLKRAGIPFQVIEKNAGVGGTWWENNYPGARVDTPSRGYTGLVGAEYEHTSPFASRDDNQAYFQWITKKYDLAQHIVFDTEVLSLDWDDDAAEWTAVMRGPDGARTVRATAVVTSVGFLNRPKIPDIPGLAEFEGQSWHSARWPKGFDTTGKRFAVIGTGCTGYQMVPELALNSERVVVFQRTPQWIFYAKGYRSPHPAEVSWLIHNFPYYKNVMRFRATFAMYGMMELSEIDPDYDDPFAPNAANRRLRDASIAHLKKKLRDPALVESMIPPHPVWSARPVNVDAEYSILEALQRPDVDLVTSGIRRVTPHGIEDNDGNLHEVDVIVFATGFHANDYLFPMSITGKDGQRTEDLWREGGARAYKGCMIPGFPNFWMNYGPNTNGGLAPGGFHELTALFILQCLERLILDDKREVEVTPDAYWDYNRMIDARNERKVWSDPRARNYYWAENHGRSATNCPLWPAEVWSMFRHTDFNDLEFR